jgi:mRNA-degrading endonuclease toxin of MazEF toxin-antitoxin module
MKANPQPGDVWTVDFGYDRMVRSALVVSIWDRNWRLAISSVVQTTSHYAGTPYEVIYPRVPWLREQSHCNAQSVQPVAWTEFQRKLGQFDGRVMTDVRSVLKRWLGI